ncbi:tetratricopeptide repeat protein [Aquimonas sp.]|uniref:tetratricopeptide repeat protein n=1 Tax=Aquimonas sp. TaxID=1872588 RepID=UPI0037BFCD26
MSASQPPTVTSQLALGQAALARREATTARHYAEAALAARPDWPEARLLLANSALLEDDLATAITVLQSLCQQLGHPPALVQALATALNNRGSRRQRSGDIKDALADLDQAVALQPTHPFAHFNRALCLAQLQRRPQAVDAMLKHLQLQPGDLEGRAQLTLWQPEGLARSQALQALLEHPNSEALPNELQVRAALAAEQPGRAAQALPGCSANERAGLAWQVGEALRQCNQGAAARKAYATADDANPSLPCAALAAALTADAVAGTRAAIAADRRRAYSDLSTLESRWAELCARSERSLGALSWSHFQLAYQGQDDTALQARIGDLAASAAAQLRPHLAKALPPPAHPRRVLLVGSVFRDCTAGAYFGGWIDWLAAAGFEVVIYQLGPRRDAETARLAASAARLEFVDDDLDAIALRLREESAGLILYPEIGMDARILPLASLRLARRQAMAWGHPVSAGLSTLDACFSCSEMEPAEPQRHYREPLRLLPGLGVDYRRPAVPAPASRRELGLPESVPLLLVPQSLFKLHPDNDAVYAELLQAAPDARLVLFDANDALRAPLQQRFVHAGIDPTRLLWLHGCSRGRYLQINAACDLMLDSLHFSGGNASLDALQAGLPVLSCAGEFMRGRQTAAMLRRLGLYAELCVERPSALAARARNLLQSDALPALSERITANLHRLFDSTEARHAFIAHIEELCS